MSRRNIPSVLALLALVLPISVNAKITSPGHSSSPVIRPHRGLRIAPIPKAIIKPPDRVTAPADLPARKFRPVPVVLNTARRGRPMRIFNPLRLSNLPGASDEAAVAATKDFEIEPVFMAGTPSLIYSRGGGDPKLGAYPDTKGKDTTLKEPTFLAGTDYLLVGPNGVVQFYKSGKARGEFFEPSTGRAQDPDNITETRRLAFSAFLPGDDAAYTGSGDQPGIAVRVIGYSDDGLNPTVKQPAISKVLPPMEYGQGTGKDADGKDVSYSLFAPDASPTVYPCNSRFIAFVSLRGYTPGDGKDILPDPTTFYTSLWLWDTADDTNPPIQLLRIAGKSILQPRFSPDGKYIAFTVSDVAFPPGAWAATNGVALTAAAPDFVHSFDVLPVADPASALTKPMEASVYVSPVTLPDPTVSDIPSLGNPIQVTSFETVDGIARDMMPFWSELNQLGFSSDRIDADDDGYADSLPATPAAGRFSIYTFPRSFVAPVQADPANPKPYEDPSTPELTPSRQLVGPAIMGKDNALKGDWAPMAPTSGVGSALFVGNTDNANVFGNNVLAAIAPRLVCQTNKGGNADLWGASRAVRTVFNGHLLSDLPVVTPKEGTPGEPVTIDVDVTPDYLERDATTDPPTLKSRVFAIVKDPDNRIFHLSNGLPVVDAITQANNGVVTMIYREINSDLAYFDGASLAAYATRYADDPNPPQVGALIELTENPAGSNHFTAQWSTPLEASDYILDIVVDTANVPMISDNIQGFTTAPFVPYSPLLVVSDFAQGQQAIPYTTLTPSTAGVPTESYFTQRPHCDWAYAPGAPSAGVRATSEAWADLGPRIEFQQATLATDPGTGRLVPDPTTATLTTQPLTAAGLTGPYDLWRTQCRNPISAAVLKEYQPYTELQAGFPDTTTTRQQRVADRSVLWFAPHAGQVDGSAGRHADQYGTLGNVATQSILVDFLKAGGRMMMAGDDAAFTLAQDMPLSRNALLDRFRVKYESGKASDVDTFDYAYQRTTMKATLADNQGGLNPIPYTSWTPQSYHFKGNVPSQLALAPFFSYPRGTYLPNLVVPIFPDNMREDGALTNLFIDSVVAIPPDKSKPAVEGYGGDAIFTYDDKKIAAVQTQSPLRTITSSGQSSYLENTSAYKTVFFAFGLEGIDREYRISSGACNAWNPKALLLHNVADYLITGAVSGTVFLNNSTTPVNNVIVRAVDQYRSDAKGLLRCIATSGPSTVSPNNKAGQYAVRGLDSSIYRMEAYKAGYVFVNAAGATVHGGQESKRVNLYLIPVPAGTITGTVTDKITKAPLPGVFVHFHDIGGALDLTVVTGTDGTYRIDSVLAGLFDVTATMENYLPYASATPASVAAAPTLTTYDIALDPFVAPPLPAALNGTVVDVSDQPIADATVTVLDSTGAIAATSDTKPNPVITDATGAFVFSLAPAKYTVKAEVTGRATQTAPVDLAAGSSTTIKFTIPSTPPPTMLRGTILDPDTLPISGATVTLMLPDDSIATTIDSGPNPLTTGADGVYAFNVAAGTYKVKAEAASFDAQTNDVTVPADQTTTFDVTLQRTIIPGSLSGHVTDRSTSAAIAGASVRVRAVDGVLDQTVQTDSAGVYTLSPLNPGTYTVDVSAEGYDPYTTASAITITQGPDATVMDVSLQPTIVPPKPVTLIVNVLDARGSTQVPLVGATVSVQDTGTRLPVPTMDGGPNPVSTGTSGSATFHMAAGTYLVAIQAPGLRDQTRTVTLTAGGSASTQKFTFGGVIHTFDSGKIFLASAPYDFTGTDFTNVLGLSAASLHTSMVTFDPASQAFLFYPAFPSDTFHLGRGYGMKIFSPGPVHDIGTVATSGTGGYYAIPLNTGWNLIGNPLDTTVPWDDSSTGVRVRVQQTNGTLSTYKISEAMSLGLLVSPLWGGYNVVNGNYLSGYASTTALLPWEGRWVKAGQPLLLLVPNPAVGLVNRMPKRHLTTSHSPLRAPAGVWGLNITACSGKLVDDDLALGIDLKAASGYDRGMDLAKPDPMDTSIPYLTTSFKQTWSGRSGAYATDVRGDLTRSDWTFNVATNLAGADIVLTWTPNGTLPAGTSLTLVEVSSGKRVDLKSATGFTFRTGRAQRLAAFRVELRGPGGSGRR